jgi:hypothetical protein
MKKTLSLFNLRVLFFILVTIGSFSCQKRFELSRAVDDPNTIFPTTQKDIESAALIDEVGKALESVYKNSDALDEVDGAIYSGYEADESISIANLLLPNSGLYSWDKFISKHIKRGSFYKEFSKVVSNNSYPLISKYYGRLLNREKRQSQFSEASSATLPEYALAGDTLLPETFLVNNVKIYFPYSDVWGSFYNPNTTGINELPGNKFVTIVRGSREADSGPGQEPYIISGPTQVVYRIVTVDDNYAENTKPTHIVGIQDLIMDPPPPPVPPIRATIYKTYIGWVKCNKQYDKLISIHDGGGPELRFGRGYAMLNATGQVITGMPFLPANLKRRDCRHGGSWIHVLLSWDDNWTVEKVNQGFSIYEQDSKGSSTISATVTYRLTDNTTASTTVSSTVNSQDAIIRNTEKNRDSYFSTGTYNQGFGFQDSWPIIDGTTTVAYTMPYQIFN